MIAFICFIFFIIILLQSSLFDFFCTIYFTTKTLYTIVHLSLEEFNFYLKSSLSTQSVCHTINPRVGVKVPQKQGLCILDLVQSGVFTTAWRHCRASHTDSGPTKTQNVLRNQLCSKTYLLVADLHCTLVMGLHGNGPKMCKKKSNAMLTSV